MEAVWLHETKQKKNGRRYAANQSIKQSINKERFNAPCTLQLREGKKGIITCNNQTIRHAVAMSVHMM